MMLSMEKTRSRTRICPIAAAKLSRALPPAACLGLRIDGVVDLLRRLPEQEQAAGDEDQVAPGEGLAEDLEDRLGELDDVGDRAQQPEAQDESEADADAPGLGLMLRRQLVRQDRDEDEVVDAEHHLHHDQRGEGGPGGGIAGELKQAVHVARSWVGTAEGVRIAKAKGKGEARSAWRVRPGTRTRSGAKMRTALGHDLEMGRRVGGELAVGVDRARTPAGLHHDLLGLKARTSAARPCVPLRRAGSSASSRHQ